MAKRGRPRKRGRPSKAARKRHAKHSRKRRWVKKHGKKALKKIKGGKRVAKAKAALTRLSHVRGRKTKKQLAAVRKHRATLRKAGVPMNKRKTAPLFRRKRARRSRRRSRK